ncbi:MAG: NAD(P)-dependent oxidoreductase [Bacteroidales bacterium]|nr:NAD(P)-dependent oxidoreductase [Bacteroidales bacterium]
MKTILITGINGFLGSNLAKTLCQNHNIIGLEYSIKSLDRIKNYNFKVYCAENEIPDEVFTEQSIDFIIHTATFYGKQNESTDIIAKANLFIPFELLEKAIIFKCKLFINTDTVLDRFVNTYALSKRHFQEWLYIRRNEIKIINMQLEHFYGPGASNSNFITNMIDRLKSDEDIIDLTLGEQKRGFVYIEDVISAYEIVINKVLEIPNSYTEFQVTVNQLISVKELMLSLKRLTNSKSKLNFGSLSYRENELLESKTDNKKLVKLGWNPTTELNQGLEFTILSELKIKN